MEKRIINRDMEYLGGAGTNEGNIIQFLCGEKSYMGKWFGEKIEGAQFWWRKYLRAEIDSKDSEICSLKNQLSASQKEAKELRLLVEKGNIVILNACYENVGRLDWQNMKSEFEKEYHALKSQKKTP